MRRKDRELKCLEDIFSVVKNCAVVHVAMVDDGKPYVVALNFGFDRQGDSLILYLHSAQEGKKIDILRKTRLCIFRWIVLMNLSGVHRRILAATAGGLTA